MRPHLRLFSGDGYVARPEPPKVSVQLSELIDVLRHSVRMDRVWLDDFNSEEVQISEDLYEVLTAYRSLRQGA